MNLFKLAAGIILTGFIVTGTIIALVVFLGVKGCNVVQEKGLKSVIEDVWEGPLDELPETNQVPVINE